MDIKQTKKDLIVLYLIIVLFLIITLIQLQEAY